MVECVLLVGARYCRESAVISIRPLPRAGGVGLESRQQHGVTLGRAPRPCLLPGPQEKVFPRNLTQLPAAPGPGEYANAVVER